MRLLLDSHVPIALVEALAHQNIDAVHLSSWRNGALLHAPDDEILLDAHAERLVFVTADHQTVPDLLRTWAADGQPHGGVILLQDPDTRGDNVGRVARMLGGVHDDLSEVDWTDRIVPLPRAE